MQTGPVSRRGFLVAAPAAAAAAAAAQSGGNIAASGMVRIITMNKFEPDEVAKIKAAAPGKVELVIAKDREEFRAKLRDADVVYGDLRKEDLDYGPKLKWMQAGGAGMEGADKTVMASNITITNMARVFAPAIAETAFGLLLGLTRNIATQYVPQFAKRTMNPVGTVKSANYMELGGKTMGIVAMGGIGTEIARRAHNGFDMTVYATDARPIPKPEFVAELHDPGWFMEMVPKVDVLVSAAPLTPLTTGMFNEKVFRSMKKTAYFLGMSRGKLFDDMALVKALKEGWIAGAGLDVFPQEPPPSNHPIFDCPNVVMSAHSSGWGPERQTRLVAHFSENVRRYANGLPLVAVVDKAAGY